MCSEVGLVILGMGMGRLMIHALWFSQELEGKGKETYSFLVSLYTGIPYLVMAFIMMVVYWLRGWTTNWNLSFGLSTYQLNNSGQII